ncbi:MAG: hypothetical protein LBV43_05825 [Prevotella sp.]|jgi:hypothetical protein|nr:hypothetical protein [Prevotella sp.]
MKYLALFLSFLLITMIACNSNSSKVDYYKDYHDFSFVSDSIMPEGQKAFLRDLILVMYDNMTVEDNLIKFNLSKKEFIEKGFNEKYYKHIEKNIEELNAYFSSSQENAEEMLNKSREEILESLKK